MQDDLIILEFETLNKKIGTKNSNFKKTKE